MFSNNIIDLRKPLSPSIAGEAPHYYKQITWSNGVPVNIKKYLNEAHTVLAHDVTITWSGGVPIIVSDLDVISNITTAKTITWENGVPTAVG